MAITIARTPMVDDDGSGTAGTVVNNAWLTALYDAIDAALASIDTAASLPAAHAVTHTAGGADALALDTLAAPADTATLNATAAAHGLLPKLSGNAAHVLTGTGAWQTPAVAWPGGVTGNLAFPTDQVPSGDAHTLDDYEEGSWTPLDVSGAGLTLAYAACHYTKVGALVVLTVQVNFPSTSNAANAAISLPFTSVSAGTNRHGVAIAQTTFVSSPLTAAVDAGTNKLVFLNVTTQVNLTNANLSGHVLILSAAYRATG